MDPQVMIAQMRGDFRASRGLTAALIALVVAGLVSWLPALSARGTLGGSHGRQVGDAVLSDPFASSNAPSARGNTSQE